MLPMKRSSVMVEKFISSRIVSQDGGMETGNWVEYNGDWVAGLKVASFRSNV